MYNEYNRTVNKFKKQGVEEAMWSNTICVRNLQTLAHFVGAVHAGQCSEKFWEVSQQQTSKLSLERGKVWLWRLSGWYKGHFYFYWQEGFFKDYMLMNYFRMKNNFKA